MTKGEVAGSNWASVDALARRMGFDTAGFVIGQLVKFGELFLTWNAAINLGGARSFGTLVDSHFIDAFAACRFISPGDSVIDVGSGGGLPAIPTALLASQARFDLFEPTAKKVAFLRTAIRELALGDRVSVHAERVTDPPEASIAGRFDVASARATLPPLAWLPLGRALIQGGGRVLVFATAREISGLPRSSGELLYAPGRRLRVFGSLPRTSSLPPKSPVG